MNIIRFPSIFIVVVIAILSIACSKSDSPIMPSADATLDASQGLPVAALSGNSNRSLLAVYDAVIDPVAKTFTVTPDNRSAQYHFPLTQMFPNALQITGYGWTPNFWADIKITHPLPGSGIDAFDPRVIAILPARAGVSADYPELNMHANNSVILTPDGYTKLHDNLGGSIQGNANPFIAYFKSVTNRRWSSTGTTDETKRWDMNISGFGGSVQFKLVVDVSTNYPSPPQSGTDNAPEPVQMKVSIGDGLTNNGGSALIDVTLLDWQGRMTIGGVYIEAPDLFNGLGSLAYSGPGSQPNEYVYSGAIANTLLAPAGVYKFLVGTFDLGTGTTMSKEFAAEVEYVGYDNLIWAKKVSGDSVYGFAASTLSDNTFVLVGYYYNWATFGSTYFSSTNSATEAFIARFNPNGTLVWAKGTYGEGSERADAVASFSDDSTVITGRFSDVAIFGHGEANETILWNVGNDYTDVFIAKYDPDGALIWAKSAGGTKSDYGLAVTTFSDQSSVIGGYHTGTMTFGEGEPNETTLTGSGSFLAKYDANGLFKWAFGTAVGQCSSLATLSSDNFVVSGSDGDLYVAEFNLSGSLQWAKYVFGDGYGVGLGITALSDDSTVITGEFTGVHVFGAGEENETTLNSGGYRDIFVARYGSDGLLGWARSAHGYNDHDYGEAITALSDDTVVVTGNFSGTVTFGDGDPNERDLTAFGQGDVFIARYNTDGSLMWVKQAGGLDWERCYGITSLEDDSTVITGYFADDCMFGPGEENETILTGDHELFYARYTP